MLYVGFLWDWSISQRIRGADYYEDTCIFVWSSCELHSALIYANRCYEREAESRARKEETGPMKLCTCVMPGGKTNLNNVQCCSKHIGTFYKEITRKVLISKHLSPDIPLKINLKIWNNLKPTTSHNAIVNSSSKMRWLKVEAKSHLCISWCFKW